MHREFQPSRMGAGHSHDHDHHTEHDHQSELRALSATTLVTGVLLGLDLVLGFLQSPYQQIFGFRLALLTAVIGGGRVVFLALSALLEGRIGADIALAIATLAAGLAGEYFVAAEVVFIALVGECLEAFTFERAQRSIQKVLEYRPTLARVIRGEGVDQREVEIAAEALTVNDRVVIRPGERIPVDGTVISGRSAVDQAVLTGESLPIDKGEGDPVFTGTVNQFGSLVVRAEKVGSETTLGKVIRLLIDAQKHKSPLERTADRYARYFLPAVLIAASTVFLGTNAQGFWSWWRTGVVPKLDMMPALAVLVVACPCALILATPAAVLAATSRLARRGVLVKGGAAIERLAAVDAFAFDKTGTLTAGRPEIGDLVVFDHGMDENSLIRLAAAAEQPSEHPLARLLVSHAKQLGLALAEVEHFEAQPGAGVAASLLSEQRPRVLVGNIRLFRERGIEIQADVDQAIQRLDDSGQTSLLVAIENRVVGAIGARDKVRVEAHDVLHDLKHLGLKDLTILTGDRPAPARAVAKKVHVKQVESELSPAGKADWIRKRQAEGKIVAMVGDGVNDAPALALADVGLAIGGVGADIAAEAGSIVLMGDPLEPLPEAIRLARQTVRVIRQNILFFAFGLNGLAVVLAGLRVLGPVAAAVLHQIGSLLVLLNAIRLLGFERWGQLGIVRHGAGVLMYCRSCRPSSSFDWVWEHRRGVVQTVCILLMFGYLVSGVTLIEPGEIGLLQRFGRYQEMPLEPGLHVRWPVPIEQVTKIAPDLVRVARVGLSGPATNREVGTVAWNASHGDRRDASALFFTGDENLVELAAVVEYRLTRGSAPSLIFGFSAVDEIVTATAEGVFRESASKTPLEDILATGRRDFEAGVESILRGRLAATGLNLALERVRIIDAHPPREVVPAYRDVSAAVSDAERYRNEAEAYAAEQRWQGKGEALARRDNAVATATKRVKRSEGDRDAFTALVSSHSTHAELTEYRMLWETFAAAYSGRPKLVLDPKAGGRRHIWLADAEQLGISKPAEPQIPVPFREPED